LSSLSSASCSFSLSSHLVPLILCFSPTPSRVVPLILLLFPCPLLVLFHVPLPFPLILFSLSCSSLPVVSLFPYPVTLFLSLSSLSSDSCSFSLSCHLDPLIFFLSPSRLIVPFFLLLCFFPCLLLVLHHVPIPFSLILFLLSCSSLPVISLFPLSCYSVSFLIFS